MEIKDKLYSENTPSEVYYSVLMDETEYALYSEFQKEFGLAGAAWNGVKNTVTPLVQKFNVGQFVQDAKTGIKKMIGSYRKSNKGGLIDRSFKNAEAQGGGVINTARNLAQNVWNKYKVQA